MKVLDSGTRPVRLATCRARDDTTTQKDSTINRLATTACCRSSLNVSVDGTLGQISEVLDNLVWWVPAEGFDGRPFRAL